jgi:hypothetical protein
MIFWGLVWSHNLHGPEDAPDGASSVAAMVSGRARDHGAKNEGEGGESKGEDERAEWRGR